MQHAACRDMAPAKRGDPDPFFPERGESGVGNVGKAICFDCPVLKQCQDYNQRTGPNEGIWAGKTQQRGSK